MSKRRTVYRCASCGAEHLKWAGRCDACGDWNTLAEELAAQPSKRSAAKSQTSRGATPISLSEVSAGTEARWRSGIREFDFVVGGGIVPGSMVLVGGEPGIGKSTLLLQVIARAEADGQRALYISGEESPLQIKLRAERLGDEAARVHVLAETSLEAIVESAAAFEARILVLDSIQTVYTEAMEGAPGSVGQVRECAARLMRFAKESGTAVLVVGHVTKGGAIAGPKTLEHIVDTVLYFEGEGTGEHRVLRATKNRFGSVDELGVFRMTESGLAPVENPSALFMGERGRVVSGSAVTALIEGTRPVLIEIQALAAKSGFGTPQRVATGYDQRRLALLLAILEKRARLSFGQLDVFVNVVGGIRVGEPAADLAVAAALASSVLDKPLPEDALFIGEVGLGGEIRAVTQSDRRLAEGLKLGMREAFLSRRGNGAGGGMKVSRVADLEELFRMVFK